MPNSASSFERLASFLKAGTMIFLISAGKRFIEGAAGRHPERQVNADEAEKGQGCATGSSAAASAAGQKSLVAPADDFTGSGGAVHVGRAAAEPGPCQGRCAGRSGARLRQRRRHPPEAAPGRGTISVAHLG